MQKATFPMHPAQQDIYVDQLINKDSPHYNLGGYIKLKGSLDIPKFRKAVDSAPEVFDVFKMRFDQDREDAEFYFYEGTENPSISEIDFSTGSDPEKEAVLWMQNRFNANFVLKKEFPLYEHSLLKISDNEHWFFGRYHHLIVDGFGFIVFIQYVAKKYKSLLENEDTQFVYPSYPEEIVKANEYLNSKSYSDDSNYWKEKISVHPEPLLRRKYPSPDPSDKKCGKYVLRIGDDKRKKLEDIQSVTGSGIQQLIIAALIIYFGKNANAKELVFGVPVHKRGSKVLRNIVGMFSGILPFKGIYEDDKTIKDLLQEINQTQRSDYRHQNFPLSAVSRNLNESSAGERINDNLFDISLNYEPLNFDPDFGNDIKAEIERIESEYDKSPLQLFWRDYGSGNSIQFIAKYGREFYNGVNDSEIEFFLKRLLYIIEQFPESFQKEAGTIKLIPSEEEILINKFTGADSEIQTYDMSKHIVYLFEEQAENNQGNIALIFNDEEVTYKKLNERSNKIANYLRSKGVKEETLVPVCLERSIEMITWILGILKSGGAYVPIDPGYPEARISYMLKDTGASLTVSSRKGSLNLPESGNFEIVMNDDPEIKKIIEHQSAENLNEKLNPDKAAYVIYTSGSTGKPKGVVIEHKTVINLINAQRDYFNITSDDRILQFSNYSFDASVEQIFSALTSGAVLVLFEEGLQLRQDEFINYLSEKKITHLHATPAFLENIIPADQEYEDLKLSLKRVIAGGDICKKELCEYWKDKVIFCNEYGPTETTVTSVELQFNKDSDITGYLSLPIGKPLANVKAYIVNKYNEMSPIGESGEICISGDCLARGYLNLPDLTADRFVPNPFDGKGGKLMYRTGDIGRWFSDGNIEYLGRSDDQVKIRGYRIETGEIETVILESGLVKNATVLSKPDRNGNPGLAAYLIPGDNFSRNNIKEFLKKKLPDYMIPSVWIEMDKFPLTPNGKTDRKAFPEPEFGDLLRSEFKEAESELEIKLTELWSEILNIENPGVNDNFFELGGHSLNAIRLSSKINKQLNIKTDIGTIFSNPTISTLAKALEAEEKVQFSGIIKQPEKEFYELSHSQKRFWILSKFKDASEAYNVSSIFEIKGKLNYEAFRSAFKVVMERHEILRTVFVEINGEPFQKVLSYEQTGFGIDINDLTDSNGAEDIIKKLQEEDLKKQFDLEKGPLIRLGLFKISDDKHYAIFNIHHIISDGWSRGILVKEFLQLYNIFERSGKNDLKPLSLQYKDYAEWHSSIFEKQGKYWRELYKNGIPVLNFPADYERPEVISYSGDKINLTVSEKLTAGLKNLALRNSISLNNLLFLLYGLALGAKSGQEDIVIGTVSSGRSHPDLENLVGVFINFLPVRLLPEKHLKLSEYIDKSKTNILNAFRNQDYPFDLMVEDNIKKRDISRNPFFDTMMNFQITDELSLKENSDGEDSQGNIKLIPFGSGEEDMFQSVLDFKLDAVPYDLKINLHLSYNKKLYSGQRMKDFLDYFIKLLEKASEEPDNYLTEYGKWESQNNMNSVTDSENKNRSEKTGDTQSVPAMPVNICSSFVIESVQEFMEYWSNEVDLNIKINFAPYNQVFQQLINPQSLLYGNKGINFLFIRIEDWIRDKKDLPAADQIDFLDKTYREFISALRNAIDKTYIPFLVMLIPVNIITRKDFGNETINHITELNIDMEKILKEIPSVQLLEMDVIASMYEVEEIYDPKTEELGHMPFTPEFYAALGTYMTRKVSAFMNPSFKVIALDCDNTLWKGICGEAGAMNVIIDENHTDLQEFFIEKYKEGFLIVLCSKNNEDDVWEVFDKHPGMKLKREHIAAHRINWDPKPDNLLSMAEELNLGINSFIFLDDNEFETEQMAQNLPDVLSLTLPSEDESYSEFLNHIWAFDYFRITDEDRKRNEMYRVERQRKSEEENFGTLSDFLKSLEIKVDIRPALTKDLDRAVQLTLRTNQFNLNGIRKSPEEVTSFMKNENFICRIIEVKDRFGEYGIVGLVLGKINGNALDIETFLLSCRVLGRNVEGTILSELENLCNEKGLTLINLHFQPTQKNKPFQEFLSGYDWKIDPETNVHSKLIKITEENTV